MQIFHPDQQISIGGAREFVRPGRGQFNLCQMISYGIFNIEICCRTWQGSWTTYGTESNFSSRLVL